MERFQYLKWRSFVYNENDRSGSTISSKLTSVSEKYAHTYIHTHAHTYTYCIHNIYKVHTNNAGH